MAKSDIFIPKCAEGEGRGGNQSAQKSLAELEGSHPCNGKNPLSSILQLLRWMIFFIDVDFGVGWVDGGGVGGGVGGLGGGDFLLSI